MITPGRDDNYPTSSGNVGFSLGQQIGINGFHISIGVLILVIAILILYMNFTGGKRR